jgi:hypothetical protein
MDFDPVKLFEDQQLYLQNAEAAEKKFQDLTQRIFTAPHGRLWLRLAIGRANFMGSVFREDDGMNPINAAKRDGKREFISDILNAAAAGQPPNDDS